MSEELVVMQDLARRAGALQLERLGKLHHIEYKGTINLVTEVDKRCEELIVTGLLKHFPDADMLAEEGSGKRVTSKRRFIIDPLDGTVNFAHGFPFFCVSIALEEEGVMKSAVIYDPNRDELFSAEEGRGAQMNNTPIRVSSSAPLKKSLLATGFAYHDYDGSSQEEVLNLRHFGNFIKSARAVRRPGSAAIDLAWVAAGRIDGFWELLLKPWDMAAGVLLISEAGGRVTAFKSCPFDLYGEEILASNGKIHDEMTQVLSL